MKKILNIIAPFLIISCNSYTTKNESKDEVKTNCCIGLYSKKVQDTFTIFVHLPNNYKLKSSSNYNTVYVLDANYYFDTLVDFVDKNKIENTILVGVGYKNFETMDSLRNRDYTFPKALPQDSFPISGGADKFLSFIRTELLPYIDKNYRVDTNNRTLMGHSLGAYFTLYALQQEMATQNSSFKNYIAASPSIDYYNSYLIKQFKNASNNNTKNPLSLFLTFGAKEDEEDGTGTMYINNFNSIVNLLSGSSFKNIKVQSEIFPTFGHMETAVPTFTKSLRAIN